MVVYKAKMRILRTLSQELQKRRGDPPPSAVQQPKRFQSVEWQPWKNGKPIEFIHRYHHHHHGSVQADQGDLMVLASGFWFSRINLGFPHSFVKNGSQWVFCWWPID
ncbi:hypothetical protein MKW98_021730 [Papaver atlanticum]|uniref:Uncharacterized protein n=1 Tax=Papaver atlanticum TaxID=357466 RepID=A0AAD4SG39_9MAGN|nr:hypothetical protein MKW98_021730 [Papaver atlanticum]